MTIDHDHAARLQRIRTAAVERGLCHELVSNYPCFGDIAEDADGVLRCTLCHRAARSELEPIKITKGAVNDAV